MGTIVSLPAPRRRRRIGFSSTDEATILLFMGVRYVRDDNEPTVSLERPQPRVRHCEDVALERA